MILVLCNIPVFSDIDIVIFSMRSHRAGHAYSKHGLKVNSDIFSLDFAVASPNKKIIIRIWRIGSISVVSENHEND